MQNIKGPPPFLQMKGICKAFDGVAVLKDIDLTLSKGEVVGLLGENGAGKSTLMKILSGIYSPDRGEILLDGVTHHFQSIRDALKLGIVIIHQELNLLDNLDVASNIFLGREPTKYFGLVDKNKLYEEAEKILDRLKVKISPAKLVGDLSIAEQQMIEIAKALSQDTRILIMDEPTSSLSLTETQVLFEIIADMANHGVSIIYITHRLNEVYEIVDRAVVLKDGCHSAEWQGHEINRDNIVRSMVGREIDVVSNAKPPQVKNYDFIVSGAATCKYPHKRISFKVGSGEIVGLAGLVGAGRTELVNSIFGITPFVNGEIFINNRTVRISRPAQAVRLGIFLVPEDRRRQGVFTDMDVADNITLTRLNHYAKHGWILSGMVEKVAGDLIDKLNIKTESQQTLVRHLSGGNQQKIAIAKWLTMTPKLIMFDEPTRGVDIGAKSEVYKIMRQIADSGSMVLVVSSDMEEIMSISDRVIVMHEGEITGELGKPDFDEEKIIRLAVGPENEI